MSNCVHDNGEYCEVFSDKEVKQPCFETPLCEDYKEIVRCKDCKWFNTTYYKDTQICERHAYEIIMKPDDFCSRGELK